MQEPKLRSLSRHQYGTLRFIRDNNVTLSYLRHAHANTLGSVAYWRWIVVRGSSDSSTVALTKEGAAQVELYERATLAERAHEGDITERCMRLLRHSRRVQPIRHANAA